MKFLIFFLILPHLKPASLEYLWPTVESLFDVGRLASAAIIIFLFILKKKIPSKPVWLIAFLQSWIFFSTYLNRGNMWGAFLNLASIVSIALIIDCFVARPDELLSGLLPCFEIMLYANFISVLLYYPNGLYISSIDRYRCYFLGYHNSFILYLLPAIAVALLYYEKIKRGIRPLLVIAAGAASICITWSATSVCGLLTFTLVIVLKKTAASKWLTFPNIFAITIIANLLISTFRVMDRVLWMALFIESFLRKQITLTGRTFIWDNFYELFSRSPWVGYGFGIDIHTSIGIVHHMHNQWFQYLFLGGVPALILFLALNFLVGKQIMKQNETIYASIFLAGFSALYVLFIAEAYTNAVLYMLFSLAYHADKFALAYEIRPHRLY